MRVDSDDSDDDHDDHAVAVEHAAHGTVRDAEAEGADVGGTNAEGADADTQKRQSADEDSDFDVDAAEAALAELPTPPDETVVFARPNAGQYSDYEIARMAQMDQNALMIERLNFERPTVVQRPTAVRPTKSQKATPPPLSPRAQHKRSAAFNESYEESFNDRTHRKRASPNVPRNKPSPRSLLQPIDVDWDSDCETTRARSPLHQIDALNVHRGSTETGAVRYSPVPLCAFTPSDEMDDAFRVKVEAVVHNFEAPAHSIVVCQEDASSVEVFFQTEMDDWVQSYDTGTVVHAPAYASIGGCPVVRSYAHDGRAVLVVARPVVSIQLTPGYSMHYEQVYDRIMHPKKVNDEFARVFCTTHTIARIVPVLIDSRGKQIHGAFHEKTPLGASIPIKDIRFESPTKLGRKSEEDCHLRFEVHTRDDLCIAYVMFPLKMCNSFHSCDPVTQSIRRTPSHLALTIDDLQVLDSLIA